MSIKDTCAVVGIGRTKYHKRGQSWPMTEEQMAIHAINAASGFWEAATETLVRCTVVRKSATRPYAPAVIDARPVYRAYGSFPPAFMATWTASSPA
jgi:hypothetical protein